MIEFVDETPTKGGTPINRKNMLGVQGFLDRTTTINQDGSIVEKNQNGETLTTIFNKDGSITERFVGEKVVSKTTNFNKDGSITEVLS